MVKIVRITLPTFTAICIYIALSNVHAAWSSRDDERNRARTNNQIRQNMAAFDANTDRMSRNMQATTERNRAQAQARNSSANNTSNSGNLSRPSYDAVGQLGNTLSSIRNRLNNEPTFSIKLSPETDREVLLRLQQSAKEGNPHSALIVAQMFYSGVGTPRNDAQALLWFKRAADGGSSDGAYNYGYMRMYGLGGPSDPTEAVRWYQRAAESGSPRGELSFAAALVTGTGITKNEAQAIPIFKRLASRNLQSNNDPDLVESQALTAGLLGDFYRSGTGVERDITQAISWYAIAAEKGDQFAARDLAKIYFEGDGVQRDANLSKAWLAKAAELGHPEAQANLGLMLVQGKEFTKDVPVGTKLVVDAANKGDAFAWSLLGSFHEDGIGMPRSFEKAAQAYEKAIALGYVEAKDLLTPRLHTLSQLIASSEAAENDRAQAVRGNATSMLYMGYRYGEGIGVIEDSASAFTWFSKAADAGSATAKGIVGVMLVLGQGVAKDINKGTVLVKAGAVAGDATAMFTLGLFYSAALMNEANEKSLAQQWYKKALAAGYDAARKSIGD
jgi:TPR repeat protein